MNHTEKQIIFDEFAESQGYTNWEDLYFDDSIDTENLFKYIFSACDLVQKELQRKQLKLLTDRVELLIAKNPYRMPGDRESYSEYREGYSDALGSLNEDEIFSESNLIK